MQNDILAAKTMEDAASDDTKGMAFLCVSYVWNSKSYMSGLDQKSVRDVK